MLLFDAKHQFKQYEDDTGWREYWVFTKENGWMHRTQILERTEALSRRLESPKLDDDYGTDAYNRRKAKEKRLEAKQKVRWYVEQKRKIKSFGK